jgi:hypothetical protein
VLDTERESTSLPAALSRYELTRNDLSTGMWAATDALASYSWQATTAEQLMRQLSREMSREVEFVASTTGSGSMLSRSA